MPVDRSNEVPVFPRWARATVVISLAWAPFGALYVLAGLRYGEDLAVAVGTAIGPTVMAGFVGWVAWRVSGRFPWPDRWQPSFYLAHVALAVALSVAWTITDYLVLAVKEDANPIVAALESTTLGWQLIMGVWMYGLVSGISYTLRGRDRLQEQRRLAARAEALAARAQLDVLRAKVNPHFLFNALHSLSTLVTTDQEAAERAIERLGSLLRYAIDESGRDRVTVAEEWRFAQDYLALERLRLNGGLRLRADLPDEILPCVVLPFTLQPLVENAVRHGIPDPERGGTICIGGRLDADDVVLRVADDGPGADPACLKSGPGLGLRALRERLAAGGGRLDVRTNLGAGFEVTARFPQDGPA